MPSTWIGYGISLAIGVLAWWFANWIGAPVVALERLRREAREELHFHKNVSQYSRSEVINRAHDSFRRVAARIEAISMAAAVRWYCRLRKWDLGAARSGFQGLANVSGTRDERTITVHEVEVAFGFPLSDNPERIKRLKVREDRRED